MRVGGVRLELIGVGLYLAAFFLGTTMDAIAQLVVH